MVQWWKEKTYRVGLSVIQLFSAEKSGIKLKRINFPYVILKIEFWCIVL